MKAMRFDQDIIIVGLGPAGATLARRLSDRYRVTAIDRKSADGSFSKPCGGLIAPDAQKTLASFDMTLPKDVLVDPQIFSVKVVDVDNSLVRHYQRCYINTDRRKLDQWLRNAIDSRVNIIENAWVEAITPLSEGWEVSFRPNHAIRKQKQKLTARYVVSAEGASSLLRKQLYPKRHIRCYTAIQQWYEDLHPNPFYSCIFDRQATDCCSWSISKDGFFIFGGAFPVRKSRDLFEEQKLRLRNFGFQFPEAIKTEACQVLRPTSIRDVCTGHSGGFLVGEAAGLISASSLEGLSYAFDSARILSDLLNSEDDGSITPERLAKRYAQKCLSLACKVTSKVAKGQVLSLPPLRGVIEKTGIKTISQC